MSSVFTNRRSKEKGFSILEMLFATIILLVGLVAIAQLVPATVLLNYRNRNDSSALVFAQRELDEFLAQPFTVTSFTDSLGNTCSLGDPATPNIMLPDNTAATTLYNQAIINFGEPAVPGYSFIYPAAARPEEVAYEVRWAVIVTGNGTTVSSKRFIIGVRQQGGNGYFQPITLDTMVQK